MQSKELKYTLVKIHKAATQVVAGTNYYLLLELRTANKQNTLWELYLYQGFDNKLKLVKKARILLRKTKKIKKRDKASFIDKWLAPKKFKKMAQGVQNVCIGARFRAISQRKKVYIIFFTNEPYYYPLGKFSEHEKKQRIEGKTGFIHDYCFDGDSDVRHFSSKGIVKIMDDVTVDRETNFMLVFYPDGSMEFHDQKNSRAKDQHIRLRYKNTELLHHLSLEFSTGRVRSK